jgi:hypothetical protein
MERKEKERKIQEFCLRQKQEEEERVEGKRQEMQRRD